MPDFGNFSLLFSSSGDIKVGTSPQAIPARHKKSPWTSATLAQEAKELSRTVRAILEVDCKWSPRSRQRMKACTSSSTFCSSAALHATPSGPAPPRQPAVVNCPPRFSADLLDDPTAGEWSWKKRLRDVNRRSSAALSSPTPPQLPLTDSELCMQISRLSPQICRW